MPVLTQRRSERTYLEQGCIRLPYWDVLCGDQVIGHMKADYKTMTLRTFSGKATINGRVFSVEGQKSMKNVLSAMQSEINSEIGVDIVSTSVHNDAVI